MCVLDKSSCLSVFAEMFLSRRVQIVVFHALAVAVHANPHVTPAANPPAVQFTQADDMQASLCSIPLTAASLAFGSGGLCLPIPRWPAVQSKSACDLGGLFFVIHNHLKPLCNIFFN